MPENKPKHFARDYLTIPIEVYKCEVILSKTQKLTELEKLTIKFIHKQNSLKKVLNAFNIEAFFMNKVLTDLFYRGLIHLDLNRVLVFLDDCVESSVKNNTLDDFYGENPVDEKRTVTFIQEKIQGELFSGLELNDYLKNPGSSVANYLDLIANPPDTYINIKDYSLAKYAKTIRKELRAEPGDIVRINWLKPLHYTTLYIPLVEKDGKKQINMDYDLVGRDIQKIWQYSYEREFVDSKEATLDFLSDKPYFLFDRHLIINLLKDLNIYIDDLKKLNKNRDFIEIRNILDDIYEDLEDYIALIKDKVFSINNFKFHTNIKEYPQILKKNILNSTEYVIIVSPSLDLNIKTYFRPILQDLIEREIKVVLTLGSLTSNSKEEYSRKISEFIKELLSNVDKMYHKYLDIILVKKKINSNFIIIDNNIVIYNNSNFLNFNYDEFNKTIPTIITTGGNLPFKVLDFCLDMYPHDFKWRGEFEQYILNSADLIKKTLDDDRKDFISSIEKEMEELKLVKRDDTNSLLDLVNNIKGTIKEFEKFETISCVLNFEHRGILIDAMRELNKEFLVFTDIIYSDLIGPNFRKYIKKSPKFILNINTKFSGMDDTKLNIVISDLDFIKDKFPQLQYKVIQEDYILNFIGIREGFIIFSNERYFSTHSFTHNIRTNSIGLIINSQSINQIMSFITESLVLNRIDI